MPYKDANKITERDAPQQPNRQQGIQIIGAAHGGRLTQAKAFDGGPCRGFKELADGEAERLHGRQSHCESYVCFARLHWCARAR